MSSHHRIGLIVPSSNTTIETEVPEMLARRGRGETFTFHSSRAVLHEVTTEQLDRMVGQADRCTRELADARVDAMVYACLVALMARGAGAHLEAERRIAEVARERDGYQPVVTSSAGALVRALKALGVRKIAIVTPYLPALTERVAAYLEDSSFEVVDARSLSVSNNVEVASIDPGRLPRIVREMDIGTADGVIISCCVQMPSLSAIAAAERELDRPVLSAATATTWDLLLQLGLDPVVPDAGTLLAGGVAGSTSSLAAAS